MNQLKFKEKCPRHPKYKIEYIKINNSGNSQSKPLFICLGCIESDLSINIHHYILIKSFINSINHSINLKWPPVNSQTIIDELIKITTEQTNMDEVIDIINEYFKDFKQKVNYSIDQCHKKMIQIAENNDYNCQDILEEYEKISKFNQLKEYLLNQNINLEEKEKLCQNLIESSQNKIQDNTEFLQSLINKNKKQFFDSMKSINVQYDIIKNIENLNLFENNQYLQKINVEFQKTEYNDGQNCLQISKNNLNQQQIERIKSNNFSITAVSNIILDKNTKYIFKFKINQLSNKGYINIGLIQDKNKDINCGYFDKLCLDLKINELKIITQNDNQGIHKLIKGDKFNLSQENEIELRIHIKNKILLVYDHPKYNYCIGIDDQYISKLSNSENLRLFIGLRSIYDKVTLIHAAVVDEFN